MGSVTITLSDIPDKQGRIGISVTPALTELVAKHKSGIGLSLAEDRALMVANALVLISQQKEKKAIEDRLQMLSKIK